MSPKEIRTRAGRSRAWLAAHAGVSEPTCKLFELAGPEAVGPRARVALGLAYAKLETSIAEQSSGGGEAA